MSGLLNKQRWRGTNSRGLEPNEMAIGWQRGLHRYFALSSVIIVDGAPLFFNLQYLISDATQKIISQDYYLLNTSSASFSFKRCHVGH